MATRPARWSALFTTICWLLSAAPLAAQTPQDSGGGTLPGGAPVQPQNLPLAPPFPISPAQRTLTHASLQVAAFGFLPPVSPFRTATVSVPGGASETFGFGLTTALRHDFLIPLPPEALKGDKLVVTFDIPDAKSPQELGLSKDDTRKLGVGLEAIRIIPTPELR